MQNQFSVFVSSSYLDDWDEDLPMLYKEKKHDPFATDYVEAEGSKAWGELDQKEKIKVVLVTIWRIIAVLGALYFFICSLSFLASGFRLLAGKQAGEVFSNNSILNNAIAGLLVGVLVTVLVQSSSTSTSIIITMVAAELLTVEQAIPLVMGANIGTSVTSTIIALGQANERNEFRRAFAAATVHDMFNFLSVIVLLPLEVVTQYLFKLSKALIDATPGLEKGSKPPDILKAITKPFTKEVISIDKKVITKIAVAKTPEELAELEDLKILKHFFKNTTMDDTLAGIICLIAALATLCICITCIVYMLKKLLRGRIRVWLHKSVNGQVPDIKCGGITIPMGWAAGYLAMLMGLGITICVQSSSITTSALTPLVGVGVLSLDRMYPVVCGANIGTCLTGILAALAADSSKLYLTLQVAYAHLFFNLSGIVMWYAVWPLRAFPINAAKFMGNTTAKYRWFAVAYLILCFFVIPAIFVGISIASTTATIVIVFLCIASILFVALVNTLQTRGPQWLPEKLRTWEFLPVYLRSLEPFDRVFCSWTCNPSWRASAVPTIIRMSNNKKPTQHDLNVAADRLADNGEIPQQNTQKKVEQPTVQFA